MLPKLSIAGDLSYIVAGKLFHTRGPATAKLLSPEVVRVRATASVLWEDELKYRGLSISQVPTSIILY